MRHFLEIDDLTAAELDQVLTLARLADPPRVLCGASAGLVFEKPSLRTRNSMEVAVFQLGGHPVSMGGAEVGLDARETVEDVARVLSRYHAVLGLRVFAHATVERAAAVSSVPVVNLLSDDAHPCQALADLLTLVEEFGEIGGRQLAWVGDFSNVARSLMLGCALLGVDVRVACPPGYGPSGGDLERAAGLGGRVEVVARPESAVAGAHAVVTDVWTSMGQEAEAADRRRAFEGFGVDERLLGLAAPDAVFLHCLPAHRGEEVSAGALESPASRVWREAENRLHAQRGLLLFLLGADAPAAAS